MLTKLLLHQETAVNKLSHVKVGALYMEMGTGKTRTALELIVRRLELGKINHVIWLCPCSVKSNLKDEFEKHLGIREPEFITICGIQTLSTSVSWNSELLKLATEKDCYIVVDESNMIKNHKAERTRNITRIADKCKYKLILNGTPISRNEADLFSQWFLLDWRILGYKSFYSFAANHLQFDETTGRLRKVLNINYLVEKIAPYSYQVKKSECLDLPDKLYHTYYFEIGRNLRDIYAYAADKLMFGVDNNDEISIYRLFSALQAVISGYDVTVGEHTIRRPFYENWLDNPRIKELLSILPVLDNEKIIIFCEYRDEIEAITEMLNNYYCEGKAVSYYGKDSINTRNNKLNEFKANARFLVTNKDCSGYGLNLQFCNCIIYYSNDWDFGTRQQSEDRVHRLGQKKEVTIIDICAERTLDKQILRCLSKKEDLVDWFKKELSEVKDKREFIAKICGLKEE